MANISINFYSQCLIRPVDIKIYIPNDPRPEVPKSEYADRKMKTLFFFFLYTGAASNLILEDLAYKYNFAIVMVNGENSFYLDGLSTGHKYESFLAFEVVDYVRKTFGLAMTPEETYIMGFSMGGFGALHTGLAHPDRFGKIAALSSALIVHEVTNMKEGEGNPVANYEYYRECFGDTKSAAERDVNPEVLVSRLIKEGKPLPEIFMACGTEDFLLEPNRVMHKFLDNKKVKHEYYESKGQHDFVFWNEYSAKFVEKMFK